MAILEKTVFVGLTPRVIKRYENKGYTIPKYKNKKGEMKFKQGSLIEVRVDDLLKGSTAKLTKICDICDEQIPNQDYGTIIRDRESGDGKDRCVGCGRKKGAETQINNVSFEKSLAYYALTNEKLYLLEEWDWDKNNKNPDEVTHANNQIFWWNCPDCFSSYDMSLSKRVNMGCNCPYCAGKRVNHTNCLSITHPHLIEEWNFEKNKDLTPYDIVAGYTKHVNWKCKQCNHEWKATVSNRTNNESGCPNCKKVKSKIASYVRKHLKKNQIKFTEEKAFDGLIGLGGGLLRFDFYIVDSNFLIECNGEQHYKPIKFNNISDKKAEDNFNRQQEHDERKVEFCKKDNFNLIVITHNDYKNKNIENILNKNLAKLNNPIFDKKELMKIDNEYDGLRKGTKLYTAWLGMKNRCYNSNEPSYLGACGIEVCDEWLNDFMNFYNWSIENGYDDTLILGRIDNNGNFSPENCKWITMKDKNNNMKSNVLITIDGETKNVTQWAEQTGIKVDALYSRIRRGLTGKDLLHQGKMVNKNNMSGYPGIGFHKLTNKYQVYINVNGKRINLKLHNTLEEAIKVRQEAELKYFGEIKTVKNKMV